MKRITHDLVQGTQEWHQFRTQHAGASEASAMLGLSSYKTRSQLLHEKATGIIPEVDSGTQARFAAGHEFEAMARPLVEEIIEDELFPVTMSMGGLSASCDGLTMDNKIAFEHKSYQAKLFAAVKAETLPEEYLPQCQQVLMVTGAESLIFVCSDGTPENLAYMWVYPNKPWQKKIVAGWELFKADLAAYVPQEVLPTAVAAPTMSLPALSIQVNGSISLIDNLAVFGARLGEFIEAIDKNPSDDQSFADAEAAIATLKKAQEALEAAESSALAQTSSIDEMRRTVALYAEQARSTRLMLEKIVKTRKDTIRVEIQSEAKEKLATHIYALNKRLAKVMMPVIVADWVGAMRGKKTIASLRAAVDAELTKAKLEANEVADKLQNNLATVATLSAGYEFLFHDLNVLVLKDSEAVEAIVKGRITDHKTAEAKKEEEQRARIRLEEAAKAEAKVRAEEAERQRKEAEEKAIYAARIVREEASRAMAANPPVQPATVAPQQAQAVVSHQPLEVVRSLGDTFAHDSGMVSVPKSKYEQLLDDSLLLSCLRSAGVDNWVGFDDAITLYEEECEKAA